MAGTGSRFKKIGILKEKYEIIANGKTLFRWSMESLKDFFDCEFIFIYRGHHKQKEFIHKQCCILGIKKFKLLHLKEITQGQASTVIRCDNYLDPTDSVCIYNIDTYVEPNQILMDDIDSQVSGFIPSFIAEGNRWSFISTKDNKITKLTEKIRISDKATIGFYYFKSWKNFKHFYFKYKDVVISLYKETYVAPFYNYMISEEQVVSYKIIPATKIHVLGTPEDLKKFSPSFLNENN